MFKTSLFGVSPAISTKQSELKPLMHLWSLAIEEQFYLIYPVFVFFLWRARLLSFPILLALAAISFGLNAYGVFIDSVKTFFLPHTRFWELLVGACLAYFSVQTNGSLVERPRTLKSLLSVIGVSMILFAAFYLNQNDVFPGFWALLPVLGSVLIVLAGPEALMNRFIFSNKVLVWVGLISYPLYLWHWVLLSFSFILKYGDPPFFMRTAIVVFSVALSWLTYRFFELPLRRIKTDPRLAVALTSGMILVGGMGFQVYRNEGFENRAVMLKKDQAISGNMHFAPFSFVKAGCDWVNPDPKLAFHCETDIRNPPRHALIGDSKAFALKPGVFFESEKGTGGWRFMGLVGGAFLPVLSENPAWANAQLSAHGIQKRLLGDPDLRVVVLMVASRQLFKLANERSIEDLPASPYYDELLKGMDAFIAPLVAAGKKVVLTIDNPTLRPPGECIARLTTIEWINSALELKAPPSCSVPYEKQLRLSAQYRKLYFTLAERYPKQVLVFDTLPELCDQKSHECRAFLDGRALYSYSDHMSDYASILVARKLVPFVEAL